MESFNRGGDLGVGDGGDRVVLVAVRNERVKKRKKKQPSGVSASALATERVSRRNLIHLGGVYHHVPPQHYNMEPVEKLLFKWDVPNEDDDDDDDDGGDDDDESGEGRGKKTPGTD